MKHSVAWLACVMLLGPALGVVLAQDEFGVKQRKVMKTDREWAKQLTRAQYLVTRRKVTEPAFSGKLVNNHAAGLYTCVCCDAELFSSRTKFNSGTGWPSFWQPLNAQALDTAPDYTEAEPRVEVMCNSCGAHLGHVFNDGPEPTGLRYCMNSVALKFVKASATKSKATAQHAKSKSAPRGETPSDGEGKKDEAPKKEKEADKPQS